jgi:hypothetical protein
MQRRLTPGKFYKGRSQEKTLLRWLELFSLISLCVVIRINFRVKPLVALLAPVRQDSKHGQDNPLDQPSALRSTYCR